MSMMTPVVSAVTSMMTPVVSTVGSSCTTGGHWVPVSAPLVGVAPLLLELYLLLALVLADGLALSLAVRLMVVVLPSVVPAVAPLVADARAGAMLMVIAPMTVFPTSVAVLPAAHVRLYAAIIFLRFLPRRSVQPSGPDACIMYGGKYLATRTRPPRRAKIRRRWRYARIKALTYMLDDLLWRDIKHRWSARSNLCQGRVT